MGRLNKSVLMHMLAFFVAIAIGVGCFFGIRYFSSQVHPSFVNADTNPDTIQSQEFAADKKEDMIDAAIAEFTNVFNHGEEYNATWKIVEQASTESQLIGDENKEVTTRGANSVVKKDGKKIHLYTDKGPSANIYYEEYIDYTDGNSVCKYSFDNDSGNWSTSTIEYTYAGASIFEKLLNACKDDLTYDKDLKAYVATDVALNANDKGYNVLVKFNEDKVCYLTYTHEFETNNELVTSKTTEMMSIMLFDFDRTSVEFPPVA